MKKIIIVNNNMRVGGVQKSLYNLLWTLNDEEQYDITLLLFSKTGAYIESLPNNINIISCGGSFRYMGESQKHFGSNIKDAVIRGFLATVSRIFGRATAIRLMLLRQPALKGNYDCAISFLHNGKPNSFYGGVQDYVLNCINAEKKIAFLHCDYRKSGSDNANNNRMMVKFDKIAACSDGCRKAFLSVLGELKEKCVTVKNCHLFEEIKEMANEDPLDYDNTCINVITVARLSSEKGIERSIRAVAEAIARGCNVRFHIVGGGPKYGELVSFADEIGVYANVIFYGEQSNPYRYMKNADLLLLSSYHEAAPMVIDEARCLGIPVLTTETTSSEEMVTDVKCGWVCDNTQDALNEALCKIVSDIDSLFAMKNKLQNEEVNNEKAIAQFNKLIAD